MLTLFCTMKKGWGWENYISEVNTGKGMKMKNFMRGYMTYIPVSYTHLDVYKRQTICSSSSTPFLFSRPVNGSVTDSILRVLRCFSDKRIAARLARTKCAYGEKDASKMRTKPSGVI